MHKIIFLLACTVLLSCTCKNGEDPKFVVAKIDGKKLTLAELDKEAGISIYQAKKTLFDTRARKLDEIIGTRLLDNEAERQKITVDALRKNLMKDLPPIQDADVNRFYQMSRAQNYKVSKKEIRNYLEKRQVAIAENKLINELRQKNKPEVFIDKIEPERPRLKISVDDDPSKGPKNAKVTIVEFTDFECPYCNKAHYIVKRVLQEYKDKIHYVMRDFPLSSIHTHAMSAHVAANCAGEQGKYWEYSEKLWENRDKLSYKHLKKYAKELLKDPKAFDKCLKSQKYVAEIEKDIKDAEKYGVRGVPAFFINGIHLAGAVPFEEFKKIIDKEL